MCTWYNARKGYGFIKSNEGDEHFVHQTGIKKTGFRKLVPGQPVKYELSQSNADAEGKVKAIKVHPGKAPRIKKRKQNESKKA